jgi:S-(hydroxymethyl)glutathione dehydrogenase/alcohol dehydrogenase
MKASVFRGVGLPMEVEDIVIDLPGPHEVLVRTQAVGVCHSDLHFYEGTYDTPLPTILGHEAVGTVEKVGEHVSGLRCGDRVIACLSVFCGHCGYCTTGRPYACRNPETGRPTGSPPRLSSGGAEVHQFYRLSAFAEQMLVHEHALVRVRSEIPSDRAALIGCAVTTGVGAVINTARVKPGATVAVIGCGGVGLSAINGAYIAGAGRIIAIDVAAEKLALARRMGATDTIDANINDPVEAVLEMTRGGVDYSFEALGSVRTVEQAFEMLAACGTATIIGMISRTARVSILANNLLSERKLIGSNMGSNRFRVDMPRYVDFYLDGRLKLDELVTRHLQLDQLNEAFVSLRSGVGGRSVVLFEADGC